MKENRDSGGDSLNLGCMTELPCSYRKDIDGIGYCVKNEGECEYQILEENTRHWLKWENGKKWGKIQCPMLGNVDVMTYSKKNKAKIKAIGSTLNLLSLLVSISKFLAENISKEKGVGLEEAENIVVDCVKDGMKTVN